MYQNQGRGRRFNGKPASTHTPFPAARSKDSGKSMFVGVDSTSHSTISAPKLDNGHNKDVLIKDLEYLGSYSWLEGDQPTIVIPGSPRRWLETPLPVKVELDQARVIKNQNGHRINESPLAPLFEAVETIIVDKCRPDFDWPAVDFVTDRNGLRKLTEWILSTPKNPARDFRIDTQLGGTKSVLFNRWEENDLEDAPGQQHKSYGQNFEKVTTAAVSGCYGSTGYHRVVTYDFDGLKMAVRFTVDAYLHSYMQRTGDDATRGIDEVFSGLGISSQAKVGKTDLRILWGGEEVPQKSLIEMKTRSEFNIGTYNWSDTYLQLFWSQTPALYLGVHTRGEFSRVMKERLDGPRFSQVKEECQIGIRKLRRVLSEIQSLVVKNGTDGKISLICQNGVLGVYKRTSGDDLIPDKLLALFD